MSEDLNWDDINWPQYVAVPKPGQTIDDSDCSYVFICDATVQQMTIFLLHEPDYVDKASRVMLTQLVNVARARAGPDHNFLETLGFEPAAIDELRKQLDDGGR